MRRSAVWAVIAMIAAGVFGGHGTKSCADDQKRSEEKTKAQWGGETEGCVLGIRLEKESVGPCEPIMLTVTLKNVSPEIRTYPVQARLSGYHIQVKNSRGEQVPLTMYGNEVAFPPGSMREGKLAPAGEYQTRFLLNRVYDMSLKDNYFIQVAMEVANPDKKTGARVISNTVKVTVLE